MPVAQIEESGTVINKNDQYGPYAKPVEFISSMRRISIHRKSRNQVIAAKQTSAEGFDGRIPTILPAAMEREQAWKYEDYEEGLMTNMPTSCRHLSSMSARDIFRIPDKHRICQNLGLSSTGPFHPLTAVRGVILFSKSGLNYDKRQISPFIRRWTAGGDFVLKDDTRSLTKGTQYVRFTQKSAI